MANEHALVSRRFSVFQRIRRWVRKRLGRLNDRSYDIEYRPTPTAEAKAEPIDFLQFISEMRELKGVLAEIADQGSAGYCRTMAMDEEQLCDFLDWQLRQLRPLHRRMEALNAVFQVKVVDAGGGTARSIKLELLAIENAMIRADAIYRDTKTFREIRNGEADECAAPGRPCQSGSETVLSCSIMTAGKSW